MFLFTFRSAKGAVATVETATEKEARTLAMVVFWGRPRLPYFLNHGTGLLLVAKSYKC